MTADRAVADTSILISAALSAGGKPAAVLDHIVLQGSLIFSQPTFEELATRLYRPKFDRYLQAGDRRRFLDKVSAAAIWIEITGGLVACRDPNDDMVLETAIAGRATCIVSGDKDLLVMDPFRGIPILSAAAFLLRVGQA